MQETEDIVTRLQAMQRPGSESDLTVMCAEAATTIATLRAEVDKLSAELKLCGKDNCMGRRVKGVTQWVTEQAKDAAVAEARAEVEGLRADAERYRWLRGRVPGGTYRVMGIVYSEGGPGVDAAIDAAKADKEGA